MFNRKFRSSRRSIMQLLLSSSVLSSPKYISPPAISGNPYFGSTLVGDDGEFQFATVKGRYWLRNGSVIVGADANQYTLTQEDVGNIITYGVDVEGNGEILSEVSQATGVIQGQSVAAPVLQNVAILGSPNNGETLTLSYTVTGFPAPQVCFEWSRNDAPLDGETKQSFTLPTDDDTWQDGDVIKGKVIAENIGGVAEVVREVTYTFVVPTTIYGALSRAQEGAGFATTETSIVSGNESGHWQLVNGFIYPTAQGVTDQLNAGPYEFTFASGKQRRVVIVADAYDAYTSAEFQALIGLGAAVLSGKKIRVRGPDIYTGEMDDLNCTAVGAPLRIETVEGGSIERMETRDVDGVDIAARFQLRGWPKNYNECVRFKLGTVGNIRFLPGTSFRHGYGPNQEEFDTAGTYLEYERVDNIRTATPASSSYPLNWKDPTMTRGWVEFFNDGLNDVYVALGNAGVTASSSDNLVLAGKRKRITRNQANNNLDPSTDTHFAVMSTQNTSQVNARAEIGMVWYLGASVGSDGGLVSGPIEFIGCEFSDLFSGVKGPPKSSALVVMDCDFKRIYGDVVACNIQSNGKARVLRNIFCIPFSRSGIAQDAFGDAYDPHGDIFQMFENTPITQQNVWYAGNTMRVEPMREGAKSQGVFLSDTDIKPSYTDIIAVCNNLIGGSARQLNIGELIGTDKNYAVGDVLVYGITIVNFADVSDTLPGVHIYADADSNAYVDNVVTGNWVDYLTPAYRRNVLEISEAADPAALFPNFTNLATAQTRAEIDAALTTGAEAAGLGSMAAANAIDWTTSDPDAVIKWANVPSGVHWFDMTGQAQNTVVETPLSKVLNKQAGQVVEPGPGVEWRRVASDGVTAIATWSSDPGVIEPGEYMHVRVTTASAPGTTVTAQIDVNGFAVEVDITTA